jgi:methyl-accepting chemotaxis protein
MNMNDKRRKGARPPILLAIATAILAACFYAPVYIYGRDIRAGIESGITDGMSSKLFYIDFAAIFGIAAFAIAIINVLIFDYRKYKKPLRRLEASAKLQSQAYNDTVAGIGALRGDISGGGEIAERTAELADAHADSLRMTHEGISQAASSLRRLFANAAAVDNAVEQLMKNADAHNGCARQALLEKSDAETARIAAETALIAAEAARIVAEAKAEADRIAAESMRIVAEAEADSARIAIEAAAKPGNVAAEGEKSDSRREGSVSLYRQLKKFFGDARNYLEMLSRERDMIYGKLSSCSATLRETAAQANRLTLNAAVESAKAGLAGRSFAHIADGVRDHSENIRGALSAIREALDQTEAQTAAISELTALHSHARREFPAAAAAAAPAALQMFNPADPAPADAANIVRRPQAPDATGEASADDSRGAAVNATRPEVYGADRFSQTIEATIESGDEDDGDDPYELREGQPDADHSLNIAAAGENRFSQAAEAIAEVNRRAAEAIAAAGRREAEENMEMPAAGNEISQEWLAARDRDYAKIKNAFDAIRVAIRSVGATLSESSDTAASEARRIERMIEEHSSVTENIKSLAILLGNADARIDSIVKSSRPEAAETLSHFGRNPQ